jgi:hypothetical protein
VRFDTQHGALPIHFAGGTVDHVSVLHCRQGGQAVGFALVLLSGDLGLGRTTGYNAHHGRNGSKGYERFHAYVRVFVWAAK